MDRTHSFGYWLRRRRKALDLTQAELAQRVSCSLDLIQKIEADARRPSKQLAERLAERLELPIDERAAFVKAARAERAVDQLALPSLPVEQPQRSPTTNLPAQLTSLIGRAQDVATITSLLRRANVRLVTLTGPGGVGKTRLSLQVAAELVDDFADGVYFVDLAPIRDPSLVAGAIAATLGVREIGSQPLLASLKEYLRDKRKLLLLDNFEQVVDAAPVVAELLASAAHLKALVTSREVLHLRGEKDIPVPPLALPDPAHLPSFDKLSQYAAVALFIERALDARPDFVVTNANAPAVAEICARLDGLPLAIELAAARSKLFPPEALLARLSSRLALLSGGPRDLPSRQQTIRNTIAWSYDLLDDAEQTLFRRLGVFVGGCTLEAAEAVCGAVRTRRHGDTETEQTTARSLSPDLVASLSVLDGIAALLDKSLIRQVETPLGDVGFTMLETIREYALEQLMVSGELEQMRGRHLAYFLEYGERQAAQPDADSTAWHNRFWLEYDNMVAALAWAQTTAGDGEIALRLSNALCVQWYYRGSWQEMIAAYERSLNHPLGVARTTTQVFARQELAEKLAFTGSYAAARHQYELALGLARELDAAMLQAVILERLGWMAREQGDSATAWADFHECLPMFRVLGDANGVARTLNSMAGVAILEEDPSSAEQFLAESRAVAEQAQLTGISLGWQLNHLGHVGQLRGEYEHASAIHQQSLVAFADDHYGRIEAYQCLGECALARGQVDEGSRWLAQALVMARRVGLQNSISWCLAGLGTAAALDEEPERAARLWGVAERLRQSIGCRPAPATRATYERALSVVHAQLGDDAFEAAWAAGCAMTLEQAVAYALEGSDEASVE